MPANRLLTALLLLSPIAGSAQLKAPAPVELAALSGPLARGVAAPAPLTTLAPPLPLAAASGGAGVSAIPILSPEAGGAAKSGGLRGLAQALGLLRREPLPPPAAQVARSLTAAGASEASAAMTESALAAVFDGLAAVQRQAALDDLERAVKASPRDAPLRHAFLGLLARDELGVVEPKLRGLALSKERRDDVLARTRFQEVRWWKPGADRGDTHGVARRDGSITVNVHGDWRRIRELGAHFRTVFSHEYTHRLQFEGEFTRRWLDEPSAVATHFLRAIELLGLEALAREAINFIHQGSLDTFQRGRDWVHKTPEERRGFQGFYFPGAIAGAAYELARLTGRWEDAWEFHRRVSRGEDPEAVERSVRAIRQK